MVVDLFWLNYFGIDWRNVDIMNWKAARIWNVFELKWTVGHCVFIWWDGWNGILIFKILRFGQKIFEKNGMKFPACCIFWTVNIFYNSIFVWHIQNVWNCKMFDVLCHNLSVFKLRISTICGPMRTGYRNLFALIATNIMFYLTVKL